MRESFIIYFFSIPNLSCTYLKKSRKADYRIENDYICNLYNSFVKLQEKKF